MPVTASPSVTMTRNGWDLCPAGHQSDRVAPGGGFATHPHANMEILTCVLQGTIEHKDSLGHAEQIPAGISS